LKEQQIKEKRFMIKKKKKKIAKSATRQHPKDESTKTFKSHNTVECGGVGRKFFEQKVSCCFCAVMFDCVFKAQKNRK
jgi:hypothetical protein